MTADSILELPIASAVVASEPVPPSVPPHPLQPQRMQWFAISGTAVPPQPRATPAASPLSPPKPSKATKASKASKASKAAESSGETGVAVSTLAAAAAAHVVALASSTSEAAADDDAGGELDEEARCGDARSKRRPWSPEEDTQLKELVERHGIKSWAIIATQLEQRNGKQCRERWRHHLRPGLTKGEWTNEEELEIWLRVVELGTKWALLAEEYMPGRTENDIKNRWNSIVRRPVAPCGRCWRTDENELRATYLGLSVGALEGVNGWKRPRSAAEKSGTGATAGSTSTSASPRRSSSSSGAGGGGGGGGGGASGRSSRASSSGASTSTASAPPTGDRAVLTAPKLTGGGGGGKRKGGKGGKAGLPMPCAVGSVFGSARCVLRIKLSGSPTIVTQWSPTPSPQPPTPSSPPSPPSPASHAALHAASKWPPSLVAAAAAAAAETAGGAPIARPVARAPMAPPPAAGQPAEGGAAVPAAAPGFMHLLAAARLS